MDSELLSKAPREVTLAGKTYLVSKLERGEWNKLQAWLRDHTLDPVVAALGHLSKAKAAGIEVTPEDRKELFETARREVRTWPPPVASQAWIDLMISTPESSTQFLTLALRKHQPGMTDEEIARVNDEATVDESELLFFRTIGFDPVPKDEAPGGKAPTNPSPETTPGLALSPA